MAHEPINLSFTTLNVNGLGNPPKRRAVFNSLRNAKNDICFLQETHSTGTREKIWSAEWGGEVLYAHGSSGSKGVAILFARTISPSIHSAFTDSNGRYIILQASLKNWPVTLVNIYAPIADQPDSQIELLGEVEDLLHKLDVTNLIIGGDLNCCLDPAYDKYHREPFLGTLPSPASVRATLALKAFISEFSSRDVWRTMHPDERQFTFRRPDYASRLDYWFVSEHLSEWIQHAEIRPAAQSDHSAVFFSLQATPIARGPGIWRFDNSLLMDKTFVLEMSRFLETCVHHDELASPHDQWDFIKYRIRNFCISFTRRAKSRLKSQMDNIRKEIQQLELENPASHPNRDELYRSKKRELADLELFKANRIIFRARANWSQQGERPNRFFLNLEKRRARSNTFSLPSLMMARLPRILGRS